MLGIDDLHRLVRDDVGGRHYAALVALDAQRARLFAGVLDHEALDIQDNVGDVFDDAWDGADLVLDALDLDASDGTSLKAGEKNAAQAVADSDAEAALERFHAELAVGIGQRT